METTQNFIKKKKVFPNIEQNITVETKSITSQMLKVDDHVSCILKLVMLKTNKGDFREEPTSWFLNPPKSFLGKINKHILNSINTVLHEHCR